MTLSQRALSAFCRCLVSLLFLTSLFESLFSLLFPFFGSRSFRVVELIVILKRVLVVLHVSVEKRWVHGFSKTINQHVIGGNPTNGVVKEFHPFTNIKEVQSYSLVLGRASWLDACVIQ